jgi:hypothetical protein
MKYNFKAQGKMLLMTGAEIGVLGTGMLLTKKFLDFNTLFKDQIAKDPTYADKWFVKHQGAIKFGVGLLAAIHIKNPWLRIGLLSVAAVGFIEEVRVLTAKEDGTNFFNQIGASKSKITDAELFEAAKKAGRTNPTDEFPTTVGATNPTDEFPTTTGAFTDELMENSTVGYKYTGYNW